MEHTIEQGITPLLTLQLSKDEAVFATETSAAWMTPHFDVKTGARGTLGSRVAGDAVKATVYTCRADNGTLVFSSGLPGEIMAHLLKPTATVIVQTGSLLAAAHSVRISGIKSQWIEGAAYAPRGFSAQRLTGPGLIFVRALGGLTEYPLGAQDQLWVEPAHVMMFEATVGFEITAVKNAANLAFDPDEKMHHAIVKGPGMVWLQSSSRVTLRALLAH